MKAEIIRILAEGSWRSNLVLEVNGQKYVCYITRETYYKLKELGIPTAQKLRWQKIQ